MIFEEKNEPRTDQILESNVIRLLDPWAYYITIYNNKCESKKTADFIWMKLVIETVWDSKKYKGQIFLPQKSPSKRVEWGEEAYMGYQ